MAIQEFKLTREIYGTFVFIGIFVIFVKSFVFFNNHTKDFPFFITVHINIGLFDMV